MIVDNTVAYHSRQPFKGRRICYASIGNGTKEVSHSHTHLVLQSGDKMPSVGFGTWKIPQPECEDIVYKAIKNGYRCIDEADVYCNQKEAGLGINKAISEGIVSREDIWVTSKLWNTYHRKEHVMPACKKTLKDLGLDYVDLYLIHFPIASKYYDMDKF